MHRQEFTVNKNLSPGDTPLVISNDSPTTSIIPKKVLLPKINISKNGDPLNWFGSIYIIVAVSYRMVEHFPQNLQMMVHKEK